jgi:hypothetical protein
MKYQTAKKLYFELINDFCCIKYLAKNCDISYQAVWRYIKLMKALDMLYIQVSPLANNIKVYRLKPTVPFDRFMEEL